MKIRLTKDIETSRGVLKRGVERAGLFSKDGLWIRGLRDRPVADDEWELVLEDEEINKEFPGKGEHV